MKTMAQNESLELFANMISEINNPLTDEQRQFLQAYKDAYPDIRRGIERAKSAGIDIGNAERKINENLETVNNLLRIYG